MTVLLAYIHTPEGDAALDVAIREAAWRGSDAVVVNVTRTIAELDSPMSTEQTLDAVAQMFDKAGVRIEIRQLPASSDRAAALLAAIADIQPDLAVIGMRRSRAVGELILGTTSQRILRGADCPVLVVKAPTG